MPTKGSREQDKIARDAMRDMSDRGADQGIEHEGNRGAPAGPDTHAKGATGGGNDVDGIENLKIEKGHPSRED